MPNSLPSAGSRAFIYISGSDDRPWGPVEQQRDICREIARRHEWEIEGEFLDTNRRRRGRGDSRTALGRMAYLARRGHAEVIILESLDRLPRSASAQSYLSEAMDETGVVLMTAQAGVVERLTFAIWREMSTAWSEVHNHRVKRGLARRKLSLATTPASA
ncbi:recombinase family protein [Brevundimonas sp. 2R-24]|uniref:Recombinase family protein n=1 Tax=Peiella sedimenti TaxID=3061083 RepID=A0ABT8SPH0_9CAUL|nr:recombinase family protein [Caulobacteraceae bacterium XZ-24]